LFSNDILYVFFYVIDTRVLILFNNSSVNFRSLDLLLYYYSIIVDILF